VKTLGLDLRRAGWLPSATRGVRLVGVAAVSLDAAGAEAALLSLAARSAIRTCVLPHAGTPTRNPSRREPRTRYAR
jgi:hypothetical protein